MLSWRGAVNETRTRDPQLGKLMLYQLSYYRISKFTTTPFLSSLSVGHCKISKFILNTQILSNFF